MNNIRLDINNKRRVNYNADQNIDKRNTKSQKVSETYKTLSPEEKSRRIKRDYERRKQKKLELNKCNLASSIDSEIIDDNDISLLDHSDIISNPMKNSLKKDNKLNSTNKTASSSTFNVTWDIKNPCQL